MVFARIPTVMTTMTMSVAVVVMRPMAKVVAAALALAIVLIRGMALVGLTHGLRLLLA